MNPQKHNMAVLGQIVKLIPRKIIESLRKKHKIQTRSFTATSHVVAMIYSQLTHALSLNDVCDGMKNHHRILSQIRDCVPPSRNGLAHANKNRPAAMAEELFWIVYTESMWKSEKQIKQTATAGTQTNGILFLNTFELKNKDLTKGGGLFSSEPTLKLCPKTPFLRNYGISVIEFR